ncbi:hypothetical protein HK105_200442 [Polyrhizophydium stewartii]|uniref:G-protein coupled receptors family 3 profile domain-containing protein n=1 Tax=Polyrhizophydium stewartii TaxID=2732419 RepID=A0ABR4NLP1_9FUNG
MLTPLFYRFVEMVSQDIMMMIAEFKYFGWQKTGVVYSATGEWPAAASLASRLFGENNIEVIASVTLPKYSGEASRLYFPQLKPTFEFLKSTRLRIFVGMIDPYNVIDTMMAANRTGIYGRDYVWIMDFPSYFSDDVQDRWDTPINLELLWSLPYPWMTVGPFFGDPLFQAWLPRFLAFGAWSVAAEPTLYPLMDVTQTDTTQQNYPDNMFFDDPGTNQLPSYFAMVGYDVGRALARTFEQLIVDSNADGRALANGSILPALTFDRIRNAFNISRSISGVAEFTTNGDPIANPFQVWQLTGANLNDFGTPTANVTIDPVTYEGVFSPDPSKFIWPAKRAFDDVPIDFPPIQVDQVIAKSASAIDLVVISMVVMLLCVLSAGVTYLKRLAPSTVAIAGIGLAVMQADVFTLIGRQRLLGCTLRPWPLVLGLAIVLSSICAKSLHLYALIGLRDTRLSFVTETLRSEHILAAVGIGILVALIPLAALTAVAPLTLQEVFNERTGGYSLACVGTSTTFALLSATAVWLGLLVLAIAVLAFLNRRLPEKIGYARRSSTAVAVIALIAGVCGLQTMSVTSAQLQFQYEIVCVAAGSLIVCALILWPPILKHIAMSQGKSKSGTQKSRKTNRGSRSSARSRPSVALPAIFINPPTNEQPEPVSQPPSDPGTEVERESIVGENFGPPSRTSVTAPMIAAKKCRRHKFDVSTISVGLEFVAEARQHTNHMMMRGAPAAMHRALSHSSHRSR